MSGCGADSADLYKGELPERVDFNFHVKPILSDRCFACHGPDEKARKAGLRLDQGESARRVTSSGVLRSSELLRRITADDPDVVMPPAESNLTLSEYEIALISKWIEQGAEWKPHWSFIPPQKWPLPSVKAGGWAKNPIDFFILARLQREGLQPSPKSRPEVLLRRVTYDLTGLPPTVEEIESFLTQKDHPAAYENVVDRLLTSPAYGERMASEWLDLARYADSHGYQDDGYRNMWPWRDWVINAFNENMPYDEFVTWQLAGDLLPKANREQILATGFNRNHTQNSEGGAIEEEFRIEYVADRTDTFGKAFLGLTLECARCHDHKYDPISQKEYYRLFAFFNNINEIGMTPNDGNSGPTLLLLDTEARKRVARLREKIQKTERELESHVAKVAEEGGYLKALQHPWDAAKGLLAYFPLDDISDGQVLNRARASKPGKVEGQPAVVAGKIDGALEIRKTERVDLGNLGAFERTNQFTLATWVYPTKVHDYAPILVKTGGHNRFFRGYELVLSGRKLSFSLRHARPHDALKVTARDSLPFNKWSHVAVTYDGSSRAEGLRLYVNGRPAVVEIEADNLFRTTADDKIPLQIGRKMVGGQDHGAFEGGRVDEVRIYERMLTSLEIAELAGHKALKALLDRPVDEWSRQEREHVLSYYLHNLDGGYRRMLGDLKHLRDQENNLLSAADDVMVMEELNQPRVTHVLERGVYDAPAEPVKPGTPQAVLAYEGRLPHNRLGLARWLFSPDHPLTARVAVNRFWQMIFGTGLVKTAGDFGNQGELPSHPKLLDWLAVSFRESEWDVKALLKTIVMSATYRQASHTGPELWRKDPENRLLARGPSYRLPAEMVRDGALAASGLLVEKIGGPSVKPYQPEGLWEEISSGRSILAKYNQDHGDALYRRTLYTFWKRSSPPPMARTFDAAGRNRCTVRDQRTNTPLQAIVLMNNIQFVEAARLLAERMMEQGGQAVGERVRFGFRVVTARLPSEKELNRLAALHETELKGYRLDPASARKLLQVGEYPADWSLDTAELAAYTVVANALLNLDEAITKR